MSFLTVELQNSINSLCVEHEIHHTAICFSDGCQDRWLCDHCQRIHAKNHLRSVFPLQEVKSGEFLNKINQLLSQKQRNLQEKLNNKANLIQNINRVFIDIQNEIEMVLIESKTQIIHQIDKIYQGLSQDYDETHFSQINEYLSSLAQKIKTEERARVIADIENFSSIYSKALFALNDGIETTSKLEEKNIDFKQMLENVKSSCNKIASNLFEEVSNDFASKGFSKQQTKLTPQEITCMTHCAEYGLLVTGGQNGLLTLWDDKTFNCVSQLQLYDGSVTLATYLASTRTIITTSRDSIGMTKINPDGSLAHWEKIKIHKTLQHVVAIEGEDKIATLSQHGEKVRFWKSTERSLDYVTSINVPIANSSTKLLFIKGAKQIAVVYTDNIKIFSLVNLSCVADLHPQQYSMQSSIHDLSAQFHIISACYVEKTNTVHTIVSQSAINAVKYLDLVWEKTPEGTYILVNSKEIDGIDKYGQPLELFANSGTILTVFKHAFMLYKANNSKSHMFVTQDCLGQNQQPTLLINDGTKTIITDAKNPKKFKVFEF